MEYKYYRLESDSRLVECPQSPVDASGQEGAQQSLIDDQAPPAAQQSPRLALLPPEPPAPKPNLITSGLLFLILLELLMAGYLWIS